THQARFTVCGGERFAGFGVVENYTSVRQVTGCTIRWSYRDPPPHVGMGVAENHSFRSYICFVIHRQLSPGIRRQVCILTAEVETIWRSLPTGEEPVRKYLPWKCCE